MEDPLICELYNYSFRKSSIISLTNTKSLKLFIVLLLVIAIRTKLPLKKYLMDRMLPISVCDKNADIRKKITINISSVEIPNREEKVINQ